MSIESSTFLYIFLHDRCNLLCYFEVMSQSRHKMDPFGCNLEIQERVIYCTETVHRFRMRGGRNQASIWLIHVYVQNGH